MACKRPNRKKKRLFGICDASRIAGIVADEGEHSPEVIMACIAERLGFTHISLSRIKPIQTTDAVLFPIPSPAGAIIVLLEVVITVIEWLIAVVRAYPIATRIVEITVLLNKYVQDILDLLEKFAEDEPPQAKVTEYHCPCKGKDRKDPKQPKQKPKQITRQ